MPIVQPPIIKLLTTKHERSIRMEYTGNSVSQSTKILFPIIVTVIAGVFRITSYNVCYTKLLRSTRVKAF